jgi:SAM-dependent methyltransferase
LEVQFSNWLGLKKENSVTASGPSRDYHDYVFRDGVLVGDFEGMYCHSAEVPWHQDVNSFDVISDIDIAILRRHKFDRICDIGCGLGYFTARLKRELQGLKSASPEDVLGLDVSNRAIANASELHSDCRFAVTDLMSEKFNKPSEGFDLVVCRGLLWYVVHDLDHALQRIASFGREGASILVTLSFPPSKVWVGQDVLGSAEDLKDHLSEIMDIDHWCVEYDAKHGNVPLCHAFGRLPNGEEGQ